MSRRGEVDTRHDRFERSGVCCDPWVTAADGLQR